MGATQVDVINMLNLHKNDRVHIIAEHKIGGHVSKFEIIGDVVNVSEGVVTVRHTVSSDHAYKSGRWNGGEQKHIVDHIKRDDIIHIHRLN